MVNCLWIQSVITAIVITLIGRVVRGEARADEEDEPPPKSLYGLNDHVLVVGADNFDKRIYNQKRAFFVEFYSSWCGACIGYAPKYKELAREVQQWSPVVQVAALDCAEEKNLEICRDHSVDSYPTIKYFKYMSANKNDGAKYVGDKHNLETLPLDIAQLVQNDWKNQRPQEWPFFEPIDNTVTIESVWQTVPSDASLIALVVENFPSRTAWAEMIAFAFDKRIRVVQVQSSHPDVQRLGVIGELTKPRLFLLRRGESNPFYTSGEQDTWLQMQAKIGEELAALDVQQQKPPPVELRTADEEKSKVTWSQFEVQMADIMATLHYMLTAEIPRKAVIDGENLSALKQWIHALKKYVPGTVPIRKLFYRLHKWIKDIPTEVTAAEWLAQVKTIQEQLGYPLPKNMTYMACRGSKPHLRGFSCGVWTIIHAMSAQAYSLEKDNSEFNANDDLIEPFHQFIWRFFSCAECAKHFHDGILKRNMTAVVTTGDGVLWLWRTHNIVNKFIAKTPTDDPAFPKQQFPPVSLCPTCRKTDGEFDEPAVLSFMVDYYSNLKTDGLKSAPGYKVSDFEDGKLRNVEMKHLNPKFQIGAFDIDKMEESDGRLRNELGRQERWRDRDDHRYDGNSATRSFFVLWLSIVAVVVLFIYMKYRRNRSKIWKTFYYYNDYKL